MLRGFAAERVPWANMYEFALTGTLVITTVFLVVLVVVKTDLRFLGTFVTGLVLVLLGVATVNFYVSVVPLPPALQSAWLVIHVFVATSAVGFFALGFALSVVQLMQAPRGDRGDRQRRQRSRSSRPCPIDDAREPRLPRQHRGLHPLDLHPHGRRDLGRGVGPLLGLGHQGRWTFIIWVVYAGYIHARATRGWRGPCRRGSPSSASRRCSSTSPW